MNNIIQNSNFKNQNYNSKFKIDLKRRCFDFSLDVISLTDDLPKKRSAWVIADQLIRASTSIGANLADSIIVENLLEEVDEISRMIGAGVIKLKQRNL